MKIRLPVQSLTLGALVMVLFMSSDCSVAQSPSDRDAFHFLSIVSPSVPDRTTESSSSDNTGANASNAYTSTANYSSPVIPGKKTRPFTSLGVDAHVGIGGIGFDLATRLSSKFNLRAGADFFSYGTSFEEQGANVTADLRLRSGHASLDWFPFGGRFRLSPLIVFGNNNRVLATALVPSGSTITLNGQDYISSVTDPLHGNGSVDFRKVSPGFSLGFGNILPRTKSHFSVPVEAGFYYVGQPGLKVTFSGSACDPTPPASVGCQSVDQDPDFQQNLQAFIARNNNNLSYASFFPIFSIGIGYKF
jgi:hypothetical protein